MSNYAQPTWIEISKKALKNNIELLLGCVKKNITTCFCVKGNAYGHDIRLVTEVIQKTSPRSWVGVFSLEEAALLRSNENCTIPIYIMGPLLERYIEYAIRFNTRFVVYDAQTLRKANDEAKKQNAVALVHLKVETGNNRLGVGLDKALKLCTLARQLDHIKIEGISTHFANIEDVSVFSLRDAVLGTTKKHTPTESFPRKQLATFNGIIASLGEENYTFEKIHCANSAATLLFKDTHHTMVRPGVALYGMWPSRATKTVFQKENPKKDLMPVMTLKSRIGQLKTIARGEYIGYGCTYRTKRETKLAIIPIGYYDGYSRDLSNKAHVMIKGRTAPLLGRVCMNMIMVDCTDIPHVKVEDEVVLIGEGVTADQHAAWAKTINYVVTTTIRESLPRVLVS